MMDRSSASRITLHSSSSFARIANEASLRKTRGVSTFVSVSESDGVVIRYRVLYASIVPSKCIRTSMTR